MTIDLDYNAIGYRIKITRLKYKLTQEKLSEICDITPQHLSNIENGNTKVSLPTLIKIANALNVTVDYLLVDVIDNNKGIVMEEVADFFNDCETEEISSYLEILKKFKELKDK